MTKSSPRARATTKTATAKSAKSGLSATQKSATKPATKTTAKPIAKAPMIAPKLPVKKSVSAKPITAKPTPSKTNSGENGAALRATKKRAPKDLANQYGETVQAARTAIVQAAPRKRRNAAARAKLQSVITPDDGLMLRLARAGAISSSHVAGNENDADDTAFRAPVKRRSRKWETRCGKCGVNAQYSSAAALCVKCGAILVRD